VLFLARLWIIQPTFAPSGGLCRATPEEALQAALSRVSAAGIEFRDDGTERGIAWYNCSRGACRVGLGYCPGDGEVTVYGPSHRFWRHPLPRIIRAAIRSLRGLL
jgi:hypothetical protein